MQELRSVSHAMHVHTKELVVELDFHGNGSIAPALKTPRPEFKIGVTKKYLEGSKPELPDWFDEQSRKDNFLLRFRDQYQRLTEDQILFIYRAPDTRPCLCRITVSDP